MDDSSLQETDALLVDFMDPAQASYRSASVAHARKGNSDHRGTTATSSTDDDSLLDIVMDGRDDEGHPDPNQLQCE
ncbi:hypothetical protein ElyMa_000131100 [Elysia marginata]|uniref:CTNNB1 binding N-teminal domain-containing protein n=1 Tax=Elysia marginata TaxID=1093978 RepID=A0AAV4EPE6_9GAST|nr:hypothetical protein ElyMa_000131100 [Elysia marginata]